MVHEGDRLRQLSNPLILKDGEAISFRVERRDGQALDLVCDLSEVGDIFGFLATLARDAAAEAQTESPLAGQSYNYLVPIPARGIGFQHGPSQDETMIVVRLAGFDLAFSVPSSGLAATADDIARIARTLSANGKKPQ